MRILLIDDEIVALTMLKRRVDWVKFGFTEVFCAQDVDTAKEILNKIQIDLIITDIEMPKENGLSLIEYVKSIFPSTECIFLTCHANFDYIKTAMKYKAWDYLLKPIDFDELEGLLLQFLQSKIEQTTNAKVDKLVEQKKEQIIHPENRVELVKHFIEEHIQEPITVDQLAEHVYVNPQHLMRLFKRETGQSILEYITQQRIVIASKLLKESEYSISFIGDCIGCESSSYFTKLYKKCTGFSPSEYRNQFKK